MLSDFKQYALLQNCVFCTYFFGTRNGSDFISTTPFTFSSQRQSISPDPLPISAARLGQWSCAATSCSGRIADHAPVLERRHFPASIARRRAPTATATQHRAPPAFRRGNTTTHEPLHRLRLCSDGQRKRRGHEERTF